MLPDLTGVPYVIAEILRRVADVFAGRMYPSSNFAQYKVSGILPAVAGTEFSVVHKLGRLDIEYVYWLDGVGDIYASGTAWTKDTIYLKSNNAGGSYTIIVR